MCGLIFTYLSINSYTYNPIKLPLKSKCINLLDFKKMLIIPSQLLSVRPQFSRIIATGLHLAMALRNLLVSSIEKNVYN